MTDAKTVAELAAKGTQGEWVADRGDIIPSKAKEDEPIATLYEGSEAVDAQRIANVPAMEALIADLHDRNQKLALSEISAHGEAADIADQLAAAKARNAELEAESARLRSTMRRAYNEGILNGAGAFSRNEDNTPWERSRTFATLTEGQGHE